jgi:hypothetical protein
MAGLCWPTRPGTSPRAKTAAASAVAGQASTTCESAGPPLARSRKALGRQPWGSRRYCVAQLPTSVWIMPAPTLPAKRGSGSSPGRCADPIAAPSSCIPRLPLRSCSRRSFAAHKRITALYWRIRRMPPPCWRPTEVFDTRVPHRRALSGSGRRNWWAVRSSSSCIRTTRTRSANCCAPACDPRIASTHANTVSATETAPGGCWKASPVDSSPIRRAELF